MTAAAALHLVTPELFDVRLDLRQFHDLVAQRMGIDRLRQLCSAAAALLGVQVNKLLDLSLGHQFAETAR